MKGPIMEEFIEKEIKLMRERFSEIFYQRGTITLNRLDTDELQTEAIDNADMLSLLLEGQDHEAIARAAVDTAIWNLAIARKARMELEANAAKAKPFKH